MKNVKWEFLWIAIILSLPILFVPATMWIFMGPVAVFLGRFIASVITKFLTSFDKDSSEGQYVIERKIGRKILLSLSAICFLLFVFPYVLPGVLSGFTFLSILWLMALPLGAMLCIAGFIKSK